MVYLFSHSSVSSFFSLRLWVRVSIYLLMSVADPLSRRIPFSLSISLEVWVSCPS